MVKDQEFLEKKASYCLGLAKKLGATESSVIVKTQFLKLLILEIKNWMKLTGQMI